MDALNGGVMNVTKEWFGTHAADGNLLKGDFEAVAVAVASWRKPEGVGSFMSAIRRVKRRYMNYSTGNSTLKAARGAARLSEKPDA